MKKTKILLPLEEFVQTFYQKKTIKIFEQLINMNLGKDIKYIDFLNILDLDEDAYTMALQNTFKKPIMYLKWNVIDIWTNVFGRLVGLL